MVQEASPLLHFDEEINIAVSTSGAPRDRPKYSDLSRAMTRGDVENLGPF